MKKWKAIAAVIVALVLSLALPAPALAHGVHIEYTSDVEITIVAEYDTGTPMAGAQVAVYSPDEPSTPWLTGVCDDEGRFSFTPDTSRPGTWDVQVRLAGHGGIVHIPVGEGSASSGGVGGYSWLQIALMAACVVWGSVGTALYFRRRRRA
ncbi:MAG: carboxypeptidase regulatory-like domain-containing protein [Dehalococcoidia bacterium]|jgi:nickel transport protein